MCRLNYLQWLVNILQSLYCIESYCTSQGHSTVSTFIIRWLCKGLLWDVGFEVLKVVKEYNLLGCCAV
jgi:hypothetical protein